MVQQPFLHKVHRNESCIRRREKREESKSTGKSSALRSADGAGDNLRFCSGGLHCAAPKRRPPDGFVLCGLRRPAEGPFRTGHRANTGGGRNSGKRQRQRGNPEGTGGSRRREAAPADGMVDLELLPRENQRRKGDGCGQSLGKHQSKRSRIRVFQFGRLLAVQYARRKRPDAV